ncbi:MAG TPA: hypothetical protein VGI39_03655 [Polyangiaceae bacterium]|jgi:hypothetical protein
MQNRVFFPQTALDAWLIDGKVDLRGDELTLMTGPETGRQYRVVEAVRIVHEVTGGTDAHELLGRVKPKGQLDERGAEILESSLLLGDNAYDVVPGWLGEPLGTFDDYVARHGSSAGSEEELLSEFVTAAG